LFELFQVHGVKAVKFDREVLLLSLNPSHDIQTILSDHTRDVIKSSQSLSPKSRTQSELSNLSMLSDSGMT